VVDRLHGGLVDALAASDEGADAEVHVLPSELEVLVVEADRFERAVADELERAGHRAHEGAQRLGQVRRGVLEAVVEDLVQQREEDAAVLDRLVRVEQQGADDIGGALDSPGRLPARLSDHAVEPAVVEELDVGVHEHHVLAFLERARQAHVDRRREALVLGLGDDLRLQSGGNRLHLLDESPCRRAVIDDEDLHVRGRRTQRL
jgi:hypothetical protein